VQLPTVEFGAIQDVCRSRRCLVHSWREVGRMEGDATARLLEAGPNSCTAIGRVGAREKG